MRREDAAASRTLDEAPSRIARKTASASTPDRRDRQREQHAPPIANTRSSVRGGDLAVRPGVVDERREKFERSDYRDARATRCTGASSAGPGRRSVGRRATGRRAVAGPIEPEPREGLGQDVGAELRGAAAALGQLGEADRWEIEVDHVPIIGPVRVTLDRPRRTIDRWCASGSPTRRSAQATPRSRLTSSSRRGARFRPQSCSCTGSASTAATGRSSSPRLVSTRDAASAAFCPRGASRGCRTRHAETDVANLELEPSQRRLDAALDGSRPGSEANALGARWPRLRRDARPRPGRAPPSSRRRRDCRDPALGDWFLRFWKVEGDRFDYLRACRRSTR